MTELESKVLIFEKVPTKGFKLEILDDRIRRAKIPGGWLVTIRDEGITFVPDPGHEWDGGSMAQMFLAARQSRAGVQALPFGKFGMVPPNTYLRFGIEHVFPAEQNPLSIIFRRRFFQYPGFRLA